MITDKTSTKGRRRSEEKRRLVFNAAAELFTRRGFEGTSMDQIADVAGVSKQTVYSHFKSKQDLFIAAIQHRCVVNSLEPTFFDRDAPIDHILRETAQYFTHLLINTEVVEVLRVCITVAEQHPEIARTFYESGPYKLTARLKSYLDRQVTMGKLHIKNTRFAAWQFLSMLNGDSTLKAQLGLEHVQTNEETEAYIQSCVELFLRAYRGDASSLQSTLEPSL